MSDFTCQVCDTLIEYVGPGRPRYCDACKPSRYDGVQRCEHGVAGRARCEPCDWSKEFWQRRQPPRTGGGRMTGNERRRQLEQSLANSLAARKTEVAALRKLDIPEAERAERLVTVRVQMRAEVSDLRHALRDSG